MSLLIYVVLTLYIHVLGCRCCCNEGWIAGVCSSSLPVGRPFYLWTFLHPHHSLLALSLMWWTCLCLNWVTGSHLSSVRYSDYKMGMLMFEADIMMFGSTHLWAPYRQSYLGLIPLARWVMPVDDDCLLILSHWVSFAFVLLSFFCSTVSLLNGNFCEPWHFVMLSDCTHL
jgi:hypothetical protein